MSATANSCHISLMLFLILFVALFVSLCLRLSPQRRDGISKRTGRYVKLNLLTFHFAGLLLVYRNFCCELYFRSSPKLLFFASDSLPAPPFFQMVFSVTLSLTQMGRHGVLLYPEQGAEGYIDIYNSVEFTRHTVSAIHYCENGFSLFF